MKELAYFLPQRIYREIYLRSDIRELRMKPLSAVIAYGDKPFFVDGGKILSENEFKMCFERMCQHSVYHAQKDLKKGFITLCGGHRAGVCGKAVIKNGEISAMSEISGICLRIAREIKGAADGIIKEIFDGERIYNTLVISPPGCGKTTLLRDVARTLGGDEYLFRVGICDERGEIAAMRGGVSSYDVGNATFAVSECPKNEAMEILLRSMSPDVIITDEIGNENDGTAILKTINCGVKIICSCHGYDADDIKRKESLRVLLENRVFERIIVLTDKPLPGSIKKIYGDKLCT